MVATLSARRNYDRRTEMIFYQAVDEQIPRRALMFKETYGYDYLDPTIIRWNFWHNVCVVKMKRSLMQTPQNMLCAQFMTVIFVFRNRFYKS